MPTKSTRITATIVLTIFCLTPATNASAGRQTGFAASYGTNLRTEAAAQGKTGVEVGEAVAAAGQPAAAAIEKLLECVDPEIRPAIKEILQVIDTTYRRLNDTHVIADGKITTITAGDLVLTFTPGEKPSFVSAEFAGENPFLVEVYKDGKNVGNSDSRYVNDPKWGLAYCVYGFLAEHLEPAPLPPLPWEKEIEGKSREELIEILNTDGRLMWLLTAAKNLVALNDPPSVEQINTLRMNAAVRLHSQDERRPPEPTFPYPIVSPEFTNATFSILSSFEFKELFEQFHILEHQAAAGQPAAATGDAREAGATGKVILIRPNTSGSDAALERLFSDKTPLTFIWLDSEGDVRRVDSHIITGYSPNLIDIRLSNGTGRSGKILYRRNVLVIGNDMEAVERNYKQIVTHYTGLKIAATVNEINAMTTELVGRLPVEHAITVEQGSAVVVTNQLAFDDGFLAFLPGLAGRMLNNVSRFAVIVPERKEEAKAQRKMVEYFNAVMPDGKSIEIFDSETTAVEAMAGLDVIFYGTSGENLQEPSINADLRKLLYDLEQVDLDKFDEIQQRFKKLQAAVAAEV